LRGRPYGRPQRRGPVWGRREGKPWPGCPERRSRRACGVRLQLADSPEPGLFFSKRDRAVYLEFLCAPCNSEHHRVRRRAGTEYARPAASASEWHWQSKAIHSHMRGETDNVTCAAQNLGLISMHMHSAGSISFGSKVF
jgi:hypothetical protein